MEATTLSSVQIEWIDTSDDEEYEGRPGFYTSLIWSPFQKAWVAPEDEYGLEWRASRTLIGAAMFAIGAAAWVDAIYQHAPSMACVCGNSLKPSERSEYPESVEYTYHCACGGRYDISVQDPR